MSGNIRSFIFVRLLLIPRRRGHGIATTASLGRRAALAAEVGLQLWDQGADTRRGAEQGGSGIPRRASTLAFDATQHIFDASWVAKRRNPSILTSSLPLCRAQGKQGQGVVVGRRSRYLVLVPGIGLSVKPPDRLPPLRGMAGMAERLVKPLVGMAGRLMGRGLILIGGDGIILSGRLPGRGDNGGCGRTMGRRPGSVVGPSLGLP